MDENYAGYVEDSSEDLAQYGTPRHSGRYPWGSGKNPQKNKNFKSRVEDLRKQGLTDTEIARAFNISTSKFRAWNSIAANEQRAYLQRKCAELREKGLSKVAIGQKLGLPDTTVGNYLKADSVARANAATNIANMLKEQIEQKPYLDIGKGVERQLNVSDTQLKVAVEMLKMDGYEQVDIQVPQQTNMSQKTLVKVLVKNPEGKSLTELKKEVYANKAKITSPEGVYFEDYGETRKDIKPPVSLDSKRVDVRYAEDGGENKDGVIEIRKGVPDLVMGKNNYAQVRIAVGDKHFLKGMAVYSEAKDWPDGVDIMFNTNKSKDVPMLGPDNDHSVLKMYKMDKLNPSEFKTPENPFGAITRQVTWHDDKGVEHQSPLNIVNDDTDWEKWSRNLPTQFLAKQPYPIAKQQLDITYRKKLDEFKEIQELTNPTIKKKLLESFAEDCDSASVHLKAAALPRQSTHVLLPLTDIKDNEVYAPNFNNGEEVILVRFPHEGTFQIPRLRVNNDNPQGKNLLGQAAHAIGINSNVAKQLSGADFDGDTVMVIPTTGTKLQSRPTLKGLENFDPSHAYPAYEGMTRVGKGDGFHKQRQMGDISNLIMDMTIQGAPEDEITRAVKHSMTVIDAEKHNLNWKLSAQENGIAELKELYQGGANKGAATLISRAKGQAHLPEMKEKRISEMSPDEKERYMNGEKIWYFTGRKYHKWVQDKNGDWIDKGLKDAPTNTTKMEAAYMTGNDAYSLSSGQPIENLYANHADRLRALANEARKEALRTPRLQQNPSAKETYATEVKELKAALNVALKNAPYERQAHLIADSIMRQKMGDDPDPDYWDKDTIKRQRALTLERARAAVGTRNRKKLNIDITPRQWEAIQAGAISDSTLQEILRFTDTAKIQAYATPRYKREISPAVKARARTLLNMGYTQAQVAEELGISVATVNKECG